MSTPAWSSSSLVVSGGAIRKIPPMPGSWTTLRCSPRSRQAAEPAPRPASVIDRIDIGGSPRNIAITADGSRVYATNRDDNTVSVIDPTTNTVVRTVQLDGNDGPEGIAVHPDGRTVYVVNNGSSTVDAIDTATGEVRRTVPVDTAPTDVAA